MKSENETSKIESSNKLSQTRLNKKILTDQELNKYVLKVKTQLILSGMKKHYMEDFKRTLYNKNIIYYSRKDTDDKWRVHEEDFFIDIGETKYGPFFKKVSGIEIKLLDDNIFIPLNEELNFWRRKPVFYTISNSPEYAKTDNSLFFKIPIPANNKSKKINTYHYLELRDIITII